MLCDRVLLCLSMRTVNFALIIQLLEQITKMKQTANKHKSEPLEVVDLQGVSELIWQAKEQLDSSKEVLQHKCICVL